MKHTHSKNDCHYVHHISSVDEETYVNMSCGKDDATVNYKNAAAIEGSKQNSDGKLSPTKSLTPTHRIVTDR